jgi:hypothetical protein
MESSRTNTVTSTSTVSVTSTARVTTTETIVPQVPCDHFVWNLTTSKGTPVLLMSPNSTGFVCVVYHVNQGIAYSRSSPSQLSPIHVGKYSCSVAGGISSCVPNDSPLFESKVSPHNITLSGGFSFFTVVYFVKALNNANGFYDYSAPYRGSCLYGVPLAVGYGASQINSSSFTQPPAASCSAAPAADFTPFSEYVTGFNVTYFQGH